MAAPANMFLPDSRPALPLPRFSRHLHTSEGDGGESGEVCVRLGLYAQVSQVYMKCVYMIHCDNAFKEVEHQYLPVFSGGRGNVPAEV